jgi:hypothetical protein
MRIAPYLAATALLALSGCHGSGATNQENVAAIDQAEAGPGAGMNGTAPAPDAGTAVQVADVPQPAADLAPDEAVPLRQAAATASEIAQADDVERIAWQDGWAWRRHGQIIRTASRDGHRVSYFRPGESAPYLVQDGERTFAFAGGRVQHGYDRGGRNLPPDAAARQDGERLARDSSEQHRQAARAAEQPEHVEREHGGPGHQNAGDDRHGPPSAGGNDQHSDGHDGHAQQPGNQAAPSDNGHGPNPRHQRNPVANDSMSADPRRRPQP